MFVILWEYQVKAERLAEFETNYGASGAWAALFRKGAGYLGTELLRHQENPPRFITIDRWASEAAHQSFKANWREEYTAMDARCENLTEKETHIGNFSSES